MPGVTGTMMGVAVGRMGLPAAFNDAVAIPNIGDPLCVTVGLTNVIPGDDEWFLLTG